MSQDAIIRADVSLMKSEDIPVIEIGDVSRIFVDGLAGASLTNGVVTINFTAISTNATTTHPERTVVLKLSLSQVSLNLVSKALLEIVASYDPGQNSTPEEIHDGN